MAAFRPPQDLAPSPPINSAGSTPVVELLVDCIRLPFNVLDRGRRHDFVDGFSLGVRRFKRLPFGGLGITFLRVFRADGVGGFIGGFTISHSAILLTVAGP